MIMSYNAFLIWKGRMKKNQGKGFERFKFASIFGATGSGMWTVDLEHESSSHIRGCPDINSPCALVWRRCVKGEYCIKCVFTKRLVKAQRPTVQQQQTLVGGDGWTRRLQTLQPATCLVQFLFNVMSS